MKRVAGPRRSGYGHSFEEDEDEGRGHHASGLPTGSGQRSPAERAAHHAGTRASRQALIVLVLSCALIVLLRPMYGPYIDRFGVDGDQSVSNTLASRLESRASRHNLDTPRFWRDPGRGRGRPPHGRDGDEASATSRELAGERSQWRSAMETLRGAPEEDRERVIHGLRHRGGGGGGGGGETRSRGRRGGGGE